MWGGGYDSWSEAASYVAGYDCDAIFKKACESALAVKRGEAAYDRDTVLFYEQKANYPLMMWLTIIAKNDGLDNIIDLGGAMGSTYFQNRQYLEMMGLDLMWYIKEQPHFVEFGKQELETKQLHFIYDWDEVVNGKNVLICSSVLQFIDNWKEFIQQAIDATNPTYIIIERTPVGEKERIWIEKVSEPIYNASYVQRIIKEEDLCGYFQTYQLMDEWKSLVDGDIWTKEGKQAEYKSFVYKKVSEN